MSVIIFSPVANFGDHPLHVTVKCHITDFSLGKETREIVDYLWTRMEDEIIDLLENPSHLIIHGQNTVIHYEIEASQFDKSCLKKIIGGEGMYCTVNIFWNSQFTKYKCHLYFEKWC